MTPPEIFFSEIIPPQTFPEILEQISLGIFSRNSKGIFQKFLPSFLQRLLQGFLREFSLRSSRALPEIPSGDISRITSAIFQQSSDFFWNFSRDSLRNLSKSYLVYFSWNFSKIISTRNKRYFRENSSWIPVLPSKI